jgi:hypothetical protein
MGAGVGGRGWGGGGLMVEELPQALMTEDKGGKRMHAIFWPVPTANNQWAS